MSSLTLFSQTWSKSESTRCLYWHLRLMLCLSYFHCTLCRFLKLSSPRNLNIALLFSRSYRIYISYRIIQDLYFLFIYCITLFKIIPGIAFSVRLQKKKNRKKNRQKAFLKLKTFSKTWQSNL